MQKINDTVYSFMNGLLDYDSNSDSYQLNIESPYKAVTDIINAGEINIEQVRILASGEPIIFTLNNEIVKVHLIRDVVFFTAQLSDKTFVWSMKVDPLEVREVYLLGKGLYRLEPKDGESHEIVPENPLELL